MEWELIEITVDSGACDWVANKHVARAFRVHATPASAAGVWYRSACGTHIYNEGEKIVSGYTSSGAFMDVTWQVADVTKPLGSVLRMMETGNRVVFEHDTDADTYGYIEQISTGMKIDIIRKGNALIMQLWVPKGTVDSDDTVAVVTDDSTDTAPVFSRLEEELI